MTAKDQAKELFTTSLDLYNGLVGKGFTPETAAQLMINYSILVLAHDTQQRHNEVMNKLSDIADAIREGNPV